MTDGERLEDIVEAAVAQGQAPGVVAAAACGDETRIAVVLTQLAADETGMAAVCEQVLRAARATSSW
jgi:hypothetical protein